MRATLTLVAALTAVGGCDPKPTNYMSKSDKMHDHLKHIDRVHAAVVVGDLGALKAPARALEVWLREPDLPPEWEPHLAGMRRHARDLNAAGNLEAAARSVSRLGQRCGACHKSRGVALSFSQVKAPPMAAEARAHMARHHWAVRTMWEGLISADDMRWLYGAEGLADSPLKAEEATSAYDPKVTRIVKLATTLHRLGRQGRDSKRWEQRSEIYGEVLATCAGCHTGSLKYAGKTSVPQ